MLDATKVSIDIVSVLDVVVAKVSMLVVVVGLASC